MPSAPNIKPVRWIGFDMDECVGSFMPLWPYSDFLLSEMKEPQRQRFFNDLVEKIATLSFGDAPPLWLFRPELHKLLRQIVDAYLLGEIEGCFILSNNGSELLVETVREILNRVAAKLAADSKVGGKTVRKREKLFKIGWSRYALCRKNSIVKSWSVIQHCLEVADLPIMSDRSDLLFFDDMDHELQKEIPHYVKVPPYFNYMPFQRVYEYLEPTFDHHGIPNSSRAEIKKIAESQERFDFMEDYMFHLRTPSPKVRQEMNVFLEGFQRFLPNLRKLKSASGSTRKNRTIKGRTKLTHRTAKTTRRGKN